MIYNIIIRTPESRHTRLRPFRRQLKNSLFSLAFNLRHYTYTFIMQLNSLACLSSFIQNQTKSKLLYYQYLSLAYFMCSLNTLILL